MFVEVRKKGLVTDCRENWPYMGEILSSAIAEGAKQCTAKFVYFQVHGLVLQRHVMNIFQTNKWNRKCILFQGLFRTLAITKYKNSFQIKQVMSDES